jgi:hypothetical protein
MIPQSAFQTYNGNLACWTLDVDNGISTPLALPAFEIQVRAAWRSPWRPAAQPRLPCQRDLCVGKDFMCTVSAFGILHCRSLDADGTQARTRCALLGACCVQR